MAVRRGIGARIHSGFGALFPDRRLFLRSDTETRFLRLRPGVQAFAAIVGAASVGWTIFATALLLMDYVGSGTVRDQARREQVQYENRLDALAGERDARAAEAVAAQDRFNIALAQVSRMQSALLASEDRLRELETGLSVVQSTLRRTIKERDGARADATTLEASLADLPGRGEAAQARNADMGATLDFLTGALGTTARERDAMATDAETAHHDADELALEKRLMQDRNDAIFGQLEEAVTVSMEPLDRMFRAAGLKPDSVIATIRRGYGGQGGPLTPLALPDVEGALDPDAMRANGILDGLDRMNSYRLAAQKLPFAMPLKTSFRYTSGFGYRNDPKGAGRRMHAGTDLAGSYGSPVYATGDGTVVHAGWENGYGRMVAVKHDFGLETRYAHLSAVGAKVGQRVSRGDRIGAMGNSGRSTGTHLHYEVRVGDTPVNPMTYIKAARDVF